MRKFLRFSLVCLLACLSNLCYANEETLIFGEMNLVNGTQYKELKGTHVTCTFGDGDNDGKYYETGKGIRVYGDGHMTVSATGTITQIEVTYSGTNKPTTNNVVDCGTYDSSTGIWTGSEANVTFTRLTGSGHWRIQKIAVTFNEGGVQSPTISGTTLFEGSTTVTLTAEDGASIYYTTDDSDPTTASTQYSTPFTLNESATVKAIAVKDGQTSSIASKEFTKVTFTGATIADLNEYTEDKAYINLTLTNAKVVYVDGKNIHLRENGKALMMYATNMTGLTLNATVSGTIKVDYDNYNGIHEVKDNTFTNTENLTIDASSSEELDATETTISALLNKEHISDLVVIKNVSITTPDNSKYYVSDGTNEIQLWGNVEISEASVGKTTDVYALFNTIYNGTTPEIKPVSIDGVTTGINKVEVSKSDSKLYNTAGQRVDSAYKGIVIKNGKKVLVK